MVGESNGTERIQKTNTVHDEGDAPDDSDTPTGSRARARYAHGRIGATIETVEDGDSHEERASESEEAVALRCKEDA